MIYIAKIALLHRGRFIGKGKKVPDDYKRLAEGIKRGWIEVKGDPAAAPPLAKKSKAALSAVVGDPTPEQLTAVDGEVVVPEEPPEYVEPNIEDLDYLNPMAQESLAAQDIVRVRDLEGWDVKALDELRGIGVKLAERLLADFAEYAEWKKAFVEYQTVPPDTEIEVLSLEGANVEGETETEATGEDASAEDD